MALLYAPDDFSRAQTIVCTSGWDTDCNAGNVGCLMGAMLGLEGIEAGHDWRGPHRRPDADFLRRRRRRDQRCGARQRSPRRPRTTARRLSSAHCAARTARSSIFPCPAACRASCRARRESAPATSPTSRSRQAGRLQVRYSGLGAEPAAALTPTFAPPEVTRMRTYELMATPLVYPGQTVRARVVADASNAGAVAVALRALVYGANDALAPLDGEPVALAPGAETVLDLASARHGRPADPIARPCRSLAGGRRGRRGPARLSALGRTAGLAPPSAGRARRFLAPRLGQRGQHLLDQLSAGVPHLAGSRRGHDHPWRTAVDRLSGRDGAHGSPCRIRGRRRAGAGPAPLLRGAARAAGLRAARPRSGWRDDRSRRERASRGPSRRPTRFVVEAAGAASRRPSAASRSRRATKARSRCGRRHRADHRGRRVLVRRVARAPARGAPDLRAARPRHSPA